MKSLLPFFLVFATGAPAFAGPITYDYGTFNAGVPIGPTPYGIGSFSTITGSITFDAAFASADFLPGDPNQATYALGGGGAQFTASLNAGPLFPGVVYGPFVANSFFVDVSNDVGGLDVVTFRFSGVSGPSGSFLFSGSMNLTLSSSDLSVLSSDAFPDLALLLGALNSTGFNQLPLVQLRYFDSSGAHPLNYFIVGNLDSFDVASAPVPEPGTLILLGSGLVGLARIRRRRSTASAPNTKSSR